MRTVNIHGFKFTVNDEPADYWGWVESGHYKSDFATIGKFANPNAVCVDLGAWVGADTLYASRLFKHVHSVEADPVAVQMLEQNVAHNSLRNVSIHGHAVMGHTGTTTMGGALLGCSCTRQTCVENSVTVPCMTLREFCKDRAERKDIEDIFKGIAVPQLNPPKLRTRGGKQMTFTTAQKDMNVLLNDEFKKKGWDCQPFVTEDKVTGIKADYKKARVQVEVQFGNMARWYTDVFKFQVSYSLGLIDVGVLVVPMQAFANTIDENVAHYERVVRELPYAKMSITLPIWVVGIAP